MQNLYLAKDVRTLDQVIINDYHVPGYVLMERAGEAAFEILRAQWPSAKQLVVICGCGNNAGDGFVVARLAHKFGYNVRLLSLVGLDKLHGDALTAARAATEAGVNMQGDVAGVDAAFLQLCDVIIDGIFGTGLDREVEGRWRETIEAMNASGRPVLALDIPSGLSADTGCAQGVAVEAMHTVSFIGLKQGLFTGQGRHYCGEVHFADLDAPHDAYESVAPASRLVCYQDIAKPIFSPRSASAHKGQHGHVLLIGGDEGMSGAMCLAGEAALRSGAGLVSIATRRQHAALLSAQRPELMSHGVESIDELKPLLDKASVVAIGPGLGQSDWAKQMLQAALDTNKPLVVDADGLNLLAQENHVRDQWILTPHPGEAARLLNTTVKKVEQDRFAAVRALQQRFAAIVVLKGAGSLLCYDSTQAVEVCADGNSGMAVGGMGDVLTGVIASIIAQGMRLELAVNVGVCLHSAAADRAAQKTPRGMLPSDLLPHLRNLVNFV